MDAAAAVEAAPVAVSVVVVEVVHPGLKGGPVALNGLSG